MKIIEISKKHPDREGLYDRLDNLFYYGCEYLPFLFLHKINYNGEILPLPRWITKRHFNSINKKTQELMKKLETIRINKSNV